MLNRIRSLAAVMALLLPGLVLGQAQSPAGIFGGAGTFAQLPGNVAISITASAAGAATATLTLAWPYTATSELVVWPDGESRTVTFTNASTTISWTTNIVSTGTALIVDGLTTPPGQGTIGFTSDFGTVASDGTYWSWGITEPSPAAVAAQVLSGCTTITAVSATATTMRFTSTATTCAPVLLLPYSAHGWSCFAQDVTSGHSVVYTQTATAVNSCTVTATTTSGDTTLIRALRIP